MTQVINLSYCNFFESLIINIFWRELGEFKKKKDFYRFKTK